MWLLFGRQRDQCLYLTDDRWSCMLQTVRWMLSSSQNYNRRQNYNRLVGGGLFYPSTRHLRPTPLPPTHPSPAGLPRTVRRMGGGNIWSLARHPPWTRQTQTLIKNKKKLKKLTEADWGAWFSKKNNPSLMKMWHTFIQMWFIWNLIDSTGILFWFLV